MTGILYIARHAESIWNAARRIQGQQDVPLSEVGRAQAARLAARLRPERLDLIFTSDLARARDTAICVAEAQRAVPRGQATAEGTPVLYASPALRERCYGSWEGKTGAEVRPAVERPPSKRGIRAVGGRSVPRPSASPGPPSPSRDWWEGPQDGEGFPDTIQRMLGAWKDIDGHLATGATVLLVSHAAAIRALMCGLMGTPAPEQRRWQLHNVGLSRLEWRASGLSVDYWNECAHTLEARGTVGAHR